VSIENLWSLAPEDRMGFLMGKFGVVCQNCRTRLRVSQTRVVIVMSAMWIAILFGGRALVESAGIDVRSNWWVIIAVVIVGMVVQRWCSPHLTTLRLPVEGEQLTYFRSAYEEPEVVTTPETTVERSFSNEGAAAKETNPSSPRRT
jgi:hypothetical protein